MLTIAEIVSDVFQSLGNPPSDWLSLKDAVRLVRNRLAYRLTRVIQSDLNLNTSVISFRLGVYDDGAATGDADSTIDPREQILTDIGAPIWAERRVWTGNGATNSFWEYVPTVNLDSLEDWRNEGRAAVSFYRDSSLDVMKMRYTFSPDEYSDNLSSDNFRVWYDGNVETQAALEANSGLPASFNYMICDEVVVSAVPQILNNIARFSTQDDNIVSDLQIQAWQAIQQAAAARMNQWEAAFEEYRNRSRGSQRGRMRRNILRRSMV